MRRLILAILAVALWPAAAQASEGRWGLSAAGDPLLTAPAGKPDWFACPNGAPCRPVALEASRAEPGETAPGTVFDVLLSMETVPADGYIEVATDERSPEWQGRVRAVAPPALDGVAAAGSTVKPVGARWSGGWSNDTSTLLLIGCPGRERTDCRVLGDTPLVGGWHVYAVDYRTAADVPVAFPGTAAHVARPVASALVAVSPAIGPVARTKTAPDPNAKYKVKLQARALVDDRDLTVAQIDCPVRCAVELRVSDGRRTVRRKLHALGDVPLALLDAPRLRGALDVRVIVDGRRAASGVVKR